MAKKKKVEAPKVSAAIICLFVWLLLFSAMGFIFGIRAVSKKARFDRDGMQIVATVENLWLEGGHDNRRYVGKVFYAVDGTAYEAELLMPSNAFIGQKVKVLCLKSNPNVVAWHNDLAVLPVLSLCIGSLCLAGLLVGGSLYVYRFRKKLKLYKNHLS